MQNVDYGVGDTEKIASQAVQKGKRGPKKLDPDYQTPEASQDEMTDTEWESKPKRPVKGRTPKSSPQNRRD